MKNKKLLIVPSLLLILCSACSSNGGNKKQTFTFDIFKDEDYGAVKLNVSHEDFLKLPLEYGDSIDVTFSNPNVRSFTDIPYFSGFYRKTGEFLLCLTENFDQPSFTQNNYNTTFDQLGVKNGDKIILTINTKQKYLKIEKAFHLVMSNDRVNYASDSVFANLYEVKGGKLKDGLFYRSASPCNEDIGRASYVDKLIGNEGSEGVEGLGVDYVINIADSFEDYVTYQTQETSPYYYSLVNENKVDFLDLGMDYFGSNYRKMMIQSMRRIIEVIQQKPTSKILFHCLEGKDRTGVFSILLHVLGDSTYEELTNDYITSFKNLYLIDSSSEDGKNTIRQLIDIKFFDYYEYFKKLGNNPKHGVIKYLTSPFDDGFAPLSDEELNQLTTLICK